MNRQTRRHPVGPYILIPYASKKRIEDEHSNKIRIKAFTKKPFFKRRIL